MKVFTTLKSIAAMALLACSFAAAAENPTYPFPDALQLITEEPAGDASWNSRECTKYMKLLGPLEYGGESAVPSRMVNDGNGNVYIGNMFTDFEGSGWLKGSTDSEGSINLKFPQIMFDEEYSDSKHYYYYACCVRLNEDKTDLELDAEQTVTLVRDNDGTLRISDPDVAIGICYVYDPAAGDQAVGIGNEGCELRWFGIAYSEVKWVPVNTSAAKIPDGVEIQQYALCHSTGARFVELAVDGSRILIPGLAEDPEACIVGNISEDGRTVSFTTNQFLCVTASGDFFCYMVAAAPEDIEDPETGQIIHTIAPADSFTALWDSHNKTLTFAEPETGFSISNGESKVGGGDIYLEPRLSQQDSYVAAAPTAPQIVAYNPYNDGQGYGTLNFNIPTWTSEGLLVDPERMFYNILLNDGQVMTLTPDSYTELSSDMTDIPLSFMDNYDIFCMGINHALYLYSGDYERIGVQSFVEVDGKRYYSPAVYDKDSGIDSIAVSTGNIVETYYLDLSGTRIDRPAHGVFAIKCTRYDDGSLKTEKIIR